MTSEIKPEDVKLPEPVAYMTEHEQGPMLWLDRQEALSYSDEETPPIELVPADQVRAAVLEAKAQEREKPCPVTDNDYYTLVGHAEFLRRCRGETDMPAYFFDLAERIGQLLGDPELSRRAAAIRSGHSITETQRAEE